MKNKNIFLKATFFILAIIMFAVAVWSFSFSKYACLLSLILSLGAFFAALLSDSRTKRGKRQFFKDSTLLFFTERKNSIEKLPFPVAAVKSSGEIICANREFKMEICKGKDCKGKSIGNFVSEEVVKETELKKYSKAEINGKRYSIFEVGEDGISVLCFYEIRNIKSDDTTYQTSGPCVGMMVFDNKEEILRDTLEEESAALIAKLEQKLQKWVSGTSSFLRKLSDNKYLVVLEERHLDAFINDKFRILEEIREIKLDEQRVATISAGFGKGAQSLKESENWAKKALSMALGRGGDQVAIKSKESYSFYGGVSKGTEKLDKVRTRVIANALVDHVKSSDCVLIMGHKYSDLDSVGASVGMWSAIYKGQKKPAYVVINKDLTLAPSIVKIIESSTENSVFITEEMAKDLITDRTLLIVIDTHSSHFVESEDIYNECKKVVVIDHHRMMVNHIEDAVVFYHEPVASSASEMVTELVQYMGDCTLSNYEAQALLAGIMLDTKNFVLKTGVRTFEAAAFLRKKGADTVAVKRLFSNTIKTYKEKSQLVSTAEIFNSCAVTMAPKELPDMKLAAVQAADELLEIEDVRASFVIYPEGESVNVSARSMGDVNVQVLMEKIGGGGHQTMAGAQLNGTSVGQVREKIIEIITDERINV